jgi:hypothetical protein
MLRDGRGEALDSHGEGSMKPFLFAVYLSLVAIFVPAAQAQQNPLIGTWTRSDPGGPNGPPSVIYLTFAPDGRYEWRMMYGRWYGQDSGGAVIRGTYRILSPTEVSYRETSYMVCPAGNCGPYPPGDPTFGQEKKLPYAINGRQLVIGGIDYTRMN